MAGKTLYIEEINYLGNEPEDIIIIDENHKIETKKDVDGNITLMQLIDKNTESGEVIPLYENGKRVQDRIIIPATFGEVTSVMETSVAYEILKIEA